MDLSLIPSRYHSCRVLREYSGFILISAIDQNNKPVIIKTTGNYASDRDRYLFARELEKSREIETPGLTKILDIEDHRNSILLIMEGGDYTLLSEHMAAGEMSLMHSLRITSSLAAILGRIHEFNHLFGQVSPENILIHNKTGEIKLLNFSLVMPFSEMDRISSTIDLPPDFFPYMSPEQTGRMNRIIDHRTDIYSLGVTLYRLITGRLPFDTSDPMELAYRHMTTDPESPSEINPELPVVISAIVMKMIAKNPEDRYKGVYGIRYDINRCIDSLENTGGIIYFKPAQKDRAIHISPRSLLFGRERERLFLTETINSAGAKPPSLLVIRGSAGTGKTTLVRDGIQSMAKGYYMEACFNTSSIDKPFGTLIQAIENLLRRILIETPETTDLWKNDLEKIFRGAGSRMCTLIPGLNYFISNEIPSSPIKPTESGNLFNMALTDFMQFLNRKRPPFVIFLDDCHLADITTIRFMERLITTTREKGLLLIITLDPEHVTPEDPVNSLIEKLKEIDIPVLYLDIPQLGTPAIERFLIEATGSQPEQISKLAQLLKEKTDGNPFFMFEFIRRIQEDRLLIFDSTAGLWKSDIEKIKKASVTENVITILSDRILALSKDERSLMAAAYCAGQSFTVYHLSQLLDLQPEKVLKQLRFPLQQGLLIREEETWDTYEQVFKFPDERIREAIRSVMTDEDLKTFHLMAGRILLKLYSSDPGSEKIFEIAEHFDNAISLVSDRTERSFLVKLNMKAAERAKLTTAYIRALYFLRYAEQFLPTDPWTDNYELTFSVYREMAECEYLAGNREQAEELFDYLKLNAKSLYDKGEIYVMWITHLANSGQFHENLEIGRQALELFGVILPPPGDTGLIKEAFDIELDAYKKFLGARKPEDLQNLDEVSDPSIRMSLRILMNMLSSGYVSNPRFMSIAGLKAINLTLEGGVCQEATFPFPVWGLLLAALFQDYTGAYGFGLLGLHFIKRFNDPSNRSNSLFVFGNFINHWKCHIRYNIDYLKDAFTSGIETGDFVYAAFSATSLARYFLSYGHDALDHVLLETEKTMSFFMKSGNSASMERQKLMQAVILSLQGKTEKTSSLNNPEFDEDKHINDMKSIRYGTGIAIYYHYRMLTLYLFRHIPEALEMAGEAMNNISFVVSSIQEADTVFYHALCLCASHDPAKPVPDTIINAIDASLKCISKWRDNCPENFTCMHLLLLAEYNRIQGKTRDAMDIYDEALDDCIDKGFFAKAALTAELAARMLISMGKNRRASSYLTDSLYYYRRWGALGKTRQIEQEFDHLLSSSRSSKSYPQSDLHIRHESLSEKIDLMTIMEASRQISGEMVLGNLIDHLMTMVIKNTGSQKGALILSKDDSQYVYILRDGNDELITPSRPVPLESLDNLPLSMIIYTTRTHEPVILGDAMRDSSFTSDDYISRQKIHSLICMPVIEQKNAIGVLYIENGPVINAYTSDRIEVLKLLSSQIAISLKNAMTFEELSVTRESLRKNEEKYRMLFNNLQDVYYQTDAEGRLSLFSPSLVKLLGYTPEELNKINASSFYVNSTDRENLLTVLRQKGAVEDYQVQLRRKDGKTVWVATNSHVMTDATGTLIGVEGMFRDISERKNAENLLIEEKERLSVTLRNISDGVITTNIEGNPLLVNRVAEKIIETFTGSYSQESMILFFESMLTRENVSLKQTLQNLLMNRMHENRDMIFLITDKNGVEKIFETSISPIRDMNSKAVGSIIIVRDITEKSKMEQEMLKIQKLESLGIFAGGIAHDFNNILTGILGNISLARMQFSEDPKLGKRLADMEIAAIRARDLTRQLLTFSKGGNPVMKVQSVARIIRESARFVLSGSTTRCVIDLPDDPLAAEVDEGQITQVFHNILINAMQAMEKGGTVHVTGCHVTLGSTSPVPLPAGLYIEISISDEGIGIPGELLVKIFDPFFTTKSRGNGLGLTTTYSIIQKHHGYITVESIVNKGTTFHVYLPASDLPVAHGTFEENTPVPSKGGTILLMDDEEIVLNVGTEILKNLGFEVDTALSGNEAVVKYRESMNRGESYKLVIMDLTIPEHMGGKEAIGKLLEIDPDVRAIVSSGYSNDPVMMEYRKYGFKGIILKPYRVEEINEVIREVLGGTE